jgi:hypothetical protein
MNTVTIPKQSYHKVKALITAIDYIDSDYESTIDCLFDLALTEFWKHVGMEYSGLYVENDKLMCQQEDVNDFSIVEVIYTV